FDLFDNSETIGALNMTGGRVDSGAGILTLQGDLTATSDSAGNAATILGNLTLGSSTANFIVNPGGGAIDLVVAAAIAGLNLTKSGAGTAEFSGGDANTYTGTTIVADGTLDLNKTPGVNAVGGDVQVGDGLPTPIVPLSDVLRLTSDDQIPDGAMVTIL